MHKTQFQEYHETLYITIDDLSTNITNYCYYTFYMDLIYHHNIILLFCTTHH